jgi:Uma2 family endonuclease
LTREEFEARYNSMPDLKKAELIEGIVYMASAVRYTQHSRPHALVVGWLCGYEVGTPDVEVGNNPSVRLDIANEPQPDAVLFITPPLGGNVQISADGYLEGAPELAVEVAASTADRDLGPWLEAYQRCGIKEYLIWRVEEAAFDRFALREGQYERLLPVSGVLRSEIFPGLWLDAMAMLHGDLAAIQRVLAEGLRSPEHVTFVERLRRQKSGET